MTTQLVAEFDNRDGADLALLRLRRNGIDYSVTELKAPPRRSPEEMLNMSGAPLNGVAAGEGVTASRMYSAVLGSRAVNQGTAAKRGAARLTIGVNSEQALRARAIICSVKGRIL